jgi:hypothetical protein
MTPVLRIQHCRGRTHSSPGESLAKYRGKPAVAPPPQLFEPEIRAQPDFGRDISLFQ